MLSPQHSASEQSELMLTFSVISQRDSQKEMPEREHDSSSGRTGGTK